MKNWVGYGLVLVLVIGGVWWKAQGSQVRENSKSQDVSEPGQVIVDNNDFYKIEAKYPDESRDKDGQMKAFVVSWVSQRQVDWKIGGDVYNQEQALAQKFPDRPKMIYTLNINYERFNSVKYDTVSYVFQVGEYTGGANGNEQVASFTFDKNGLVNIDSVLNLAGETGGVANDWILSKMILAKTASDKETFPDKEIVNQGLGLAYLKADGKTLDKWKCNCDGFLFASNLQNFVVKDAGLEFYFGKGQISMGAAGVVSVMLDWDELGNYLAQGSEFRLPSGYSLDSYKIEKILDVSCGDSSECELPGEYATRSNCPYAMMCLENKCNVVCPGRSE